MSSALPASNSQPLLSLRTIRWALLSLLTFVGPLVVCGPVTSDVSLFDVQALTVLRGGVLYRDVLEPNLPGIVWLHLLLRSMIGWSSEAIRVFDLAIVGVSLLVLTRVLRMASPTGLRRESRELCVLVAALFYVTRNEWCHCQRDIWMLLPVTCALWFRFSRKHAGGSSAVAEGVVWGIAFWIKPHVAIPVLATILVDSLRWMDWAARGRDLGLVIVGGVVAAVPGIAWLISTGAWDHFWSMMLQWNPEYVATGRTRQNWARWTQMLQRFSPWWVLHLVAVPVAVKQLVRRFSNTDLSTVSSPSSAPLAACYLAWLFQTCTLQHAMDYIHVPEIILAMGVITVHGWDVPRPMRRAGVMAMLLLGVIAMPQLQNGRPALWWTCVTNGTSPATRAQLAQGNLPDWEQLERVRAFLRQQGVGDHELTCVNVHTIHLHKQLSVLPSTRYWSLSHPLTMYPSRNDEILEVVADSPQRFVVVDQRESSIPHQVLPDQLYDGCPAVFEAGTYVVYAASGVPDKRTVAVSRY